MNKLLELARAAKAKATMTTKELFSKIIDDIRKPPLPFRRSEFCARDWLQRCNDVAKEHGSCMALGDDIRPMPSLVEACQKYADNLGRTVESLTADERRVAHLNAVIENYQNESGEKDGTVNAPPADYGLFDRLLDAGVIRMKTGGTTET